jgi:hypothetical protein
MEAEAIALLCCESLGLPGGEYSRGYIQSWGQGWTFTERSAQRIFCAADPILRAGNLGHPVIYFDQTFRKRVYFRHPGYREYMSRLARMGVEELHAHEIDSDNTRFSTSI